MHTNCDLVLQSNNNLILCTRPGRFSQTIEWLEYRDAYKDYSNKIKCNKIQWFYNQTSLIWSWHLKYYKIDRSTMLVQSSTIVWPLLIAFMCLLVCAELCFSHIIVFLAHHRNHHCSIVFYASVLRWQFSYLMPWRLYYIKDHSWSLCSPFTVPHILAVCMVGFDKNVWSKDGKI